MPEVSLINGGRKERDRQTETEREGGRETDRQRQRERGRGRETDRPVSYTHLTLPTMAVV